MPIQDKKLLRAQYKSIRNNVQNREQKSCEIARRLLKLDAIKLAKNIAAFMSFGSEVQTEGLILKLLKEHTVAIPRVMGSQMQFLRINSLNGLEISKFDIPEPPYDEKNIINDIDIAIVPGLAFTEQGQRLGYGGGYYDKFFEDSNTLLCAICFEEQICESLPCYAHDRLMDIIVTDKRAITPKTIIDHIN